MLQPKSEEENTMTIDQVRLGYKGSDDGEGGAQKHGGGNAKLPENIWKDRSTQRSSKLAHASANAVIEAQVLLVVHQGRKNVCG